MLKLRFKDHSKADLWLVDPLITIGSHESCQIRLNSDRVDGLHAELKISDNVITFVHKSKIKNSFVNGELVVESRELKAWDVINIGNIELEVFDPLLNRSPRITQSNQATQVRSVLTDWLIQSQTAPFAGQLFPVNPIIIIGRDTNCDIAVPMPHVSRKHAQIYTVGSDLRIKDLNSSNGTFVNGEKISDRLLRNNDEIRVDDFKFKAIYTGEANEKQQHVYHTNIRDTQTQIQTVPEKQISNRFPTPFGTDTLKVEEEIAYFHGKSKPLRGKVYEVVSTGSPIGRMLGHHLSRDESSVSARHIEIFKKGRFWCIKNNGAANGLLVNGRMTTRATLVDGDEVVIGGLELIFQCEGKEPRNLTFESDSRLADIGTIALIAAAIAILTLVAVIIFT